ncbi:MAG TPA: SEC-C metal-binding domain-containing protein [Myxococcales bacterium]|jgi:hypothetical protein
MPIGPNDRCSCGSGRKYKRCCGAALVSAAASEERPAPGTIRYAFEPGTYQIPAGFSPSIACLELHADGSQNYHFVLVRHAATELEELASQVAEGDLEQAFAGGTAPDLVAERLKATGYVLVENPRIARDDP